MPYAVRRRPATEHQQSRDREGGGLRHTAYGIRLRLGRVPLW
ncbi:MAG: hypothetical protein ACR2L2_10910 [Acidobacteriota bacterium]